MYDIYRKGNQVASDRIEELLEELLVEMRTLTDLTIWAANPRDLGRSWTEDKRAEVLAARRDAMRDLSNLSEEI